MSLFWSKPCSSSYFINSESQWLPMASKALSGLPPIWPPLLILSSTLAIGLIDCTRHAPRPSQVLCSSCFRKYLPLSNLPHFFKFLLKCHLLSKAFLTTLFNHASSILPKYTVLQILLILPYFSFFFEYVKKCFNIYCNLFTCFKISYSPILC